MSKKKKRSRVIATAVMHLCEDGTYCMSTPVGWAPRDLVGLNWGMLRLAMNDLQVKPASIDAARDAAAKKFAETANEPYRRLDELGRKIRASMNRSALPEEDEKRLNREYLGIPTSSDQNTPPEHLARQNAEQASAADRIWQLEIQLSLLRTALAGVPWSRLGFPAPPHAF